jgi:DNA-binding protein WhiA
MSFASDTKKELMTLRLDDCCRLAELSALFAVNGYLNISSDGVSLSFQTTSLPLARKVLQSTKKLYHIDVEVMTKKEIKLQKRTMYSIIIKQKVNSIINELSLMSEDEGFSQHIDNTLLVKDCDRRSYIRGVFLATGSINHPGSSSYHLEMTVPNESYAKDLIALLDDYDLNARTLEKKRGVMVYVKESEKISDFLRIIGATNALLTFEDERIKRDFVNSITRVMNMEIANQNKTLEAANRQLKEIAILENLIDQDDLPHTIHEAMFLRKTYPESSLAELSDLSENHYKKRISKSGLNHRFRNISTIAKEALDDYQD